MRAIVVALALGASPARADVSGPDALAAACRAPACTRVAETIVGSGDAVEVWRLETRHAGPPGGHDDIATDVTEIRLAVRTARGWWISQVVEKLETEHGSHSDEETLTSSGVERRGAGVRWRYRLSAHGVDMCSRTIGDSSRDIEADVAPLGKPHKRVVHVESTSSPLRF